MHQSSQLTLNEKECLRSTCTARLVFEVMQSRMFPRTDTVSTFPSGAYRDDTSIWLKVTLHKPPDSIGMPFHSLDRAGGTAQEHRDEPLCFRLHGYHSAAHHSLHDEHAHDGQQRHLHERAEHHRRERQARERAGDRDARERRAEEDEREWDRDRVHELRCATDRAPSPFSPSGRV